jgi:hypothetical protein
MIKMKLSTVLLSSAALLVAGAAYAADLPAKKAAPAAAPTGCAAFGAGYIAIPGGDTCLKISGFVRSNNTYVSNTSRGTAPYAFGAVYDLQFDAQNQTEIGAVKSTILIESTATLDAYVSFGGLTAGVADDMFDIGGGYNHSGDAYGPHIGQIMYSVPVGAATLKVAAITARDNNVTSLSASRPDIEAQFSTAAGALKVSAGLASHEVVGTTGTAQGMAFIGQATYDAGVASIMGYAAYANGASKYLGAYGTLTDSAADSSALSSGTTYQGEIDVPVGKNDSIGLFAESISAKQDTSSYSKTQYAAALKHTIAKGLFVRPEIYTETVSGVVANGAYIRIQRDF